MKKSKYRLVVECGWYEADTIFSLFCEVIKHRYHHWMAGDGWVD